MIRVMLVLLAVLPRLLFRSHLELVIENLALRQQLALFKQKRSRPRLRAADRLFWVFLRRAWRHWASALLVVDPDTVVGWQRQGFRWFWRLRSSAKRVGRPRVPPEVRELIERMAQENGWGAPRIHGELLKLGILVDERTVSRYLQHRPPVGRQNHVRSCLPHIDAMIGFPLLCQDSRWVTRLGAAPEDRRAQLVWPQLV